MKGLRLALTLGAVLSAAVAARAVASAPSPQASPAPPAAFDVTDCQSCHEKAVTGLKGTHHVGVEKSCASCHGDVTGHLKGALEGEPGPIVSVRRLKPAEVNKTCLECHDKRRQANWEGSIHDRRDVSCISCHSVHSFKSAQAQLKQARDAETCFTCHASIRAKGMRRSHHPVREGKMGCASCHNPHGAAGEKLVAAGSVNELCFSCHQDKRGPFLWEHSPVREDCLTCHAPHGSNHPAMLAARITQLCQSCHQQGRHQTLAGLPQAVWNTNKQCVNCHAQIHGSNHPSGPLFQR